MKKMIRKVIGLLLSTAIIITQLVFASASPASAQEYPVYQSEAVAEGSESPVLLEKRVWLSASKPENWNLGWVSQSSSYGFENGIGYAQINKTTTAENKIQISSGAVQTIDISNMQYLEFDMWLPNADYIKNSNNWGCIELTSSGKADNEEINFTTAQLKKMSFDAGWNHIKLDLENALSGSESAINLTAVNFLRLYIFSGDAADTYSVRFGDITFTKYSSREFYDPIATAVSSNSSGTLTVADGEISTAYSSPTATEFTCKMTDSNYYRSMSDMKYFEFDLYLSSTDIINNAHSGWGVSIELRSNGSTKDDYEINWSASQIRSMHLREGWNHLKLDLSGAAASGSNAFDISQVSWFRMYTNSYSTALSGSYELRFKNLRFTSAEEPIEALMLTAAGNGGGIAGAKADAFHYKSSDATYSENNTNLSFSASTPVDIRGYQFFEFDLWVDNADTLFSGDVSIEITSGGKADSCERSVPKSTLQGLGIQNGWNNIRIALSDFTSKNGELDLSAVNYFRFYSTKYSGGKMIDNLRFTKYKLATDKANHSMLLNKCDSLSMNAGYGGTAELDLTEEEPSIRLNVTSDKTAGMLFNQYASYKFRYDFTDIEYIEFDLYTEDVGIFKNAADTRIDLTSGSGFYFDEVAVHVTSETLKALQLDYGWNHIKVPIDYSTASESFKISDVRGFRFFISGMNEGSYIKVKNFYATSNQANIGGALTEKPAHIAYDEEFGIFEGSSPFELSYSTQYTTPYTAANGEYFVQTTVPGGYSSGSYNISRNLDISIPNAAKEDLVLSMLLYIDDVKAFKKYSSAQIELSSDSSSIDNNDVYFDMLEIPLVSGWNALNLSLADAKTNKGSFDPSSILKFRMYLSCYADTVIALDDIRILRLSEVGADKLTNVSLVPEEYWVNPPAAPDYDYTFVAIPDLQEITARYPSTLNCMFNYIADNKAAMNTQFAMGLGDLTWSNTDSEFARVREAFGILDNAGIEYSNVYGNHDVIESSGDTSLYNTYFDYNYYSENFQSFGGAYEEGSMDNAYYTLNVEGMKYLILTLEYISGENAGLIEWADEVVKTHGDYNVIVTTHAYIKSDGSYIPGKGDYLWENLISKHSNIFAVICGHVINDADEGSCVSQTAIGDSGNTVYEFMFNSQDVDTYYNGLGMLMFMHFSNEGKTITFHYYSPLYGAYYKDANQFTINLDDSAYIPALSGDVNGDNRVDIKDLIRIKRFLAEDGSDVLEYSADIAKNGVVDSHDLAEIRKMLLIA